MGGRRGGRGGAWRPALLQGIPWILCAPVHAYVDPGAGGVLLQAVLGAAVGCLLVFRRGLARGIRRFARLWRRRGR